MVDILYLAKGRQQFTRESWDRLYRNTNWSLVDSLRVYSDGGDDSLFAALRPGFGYDRCAYGGPVAVMNDFLSRPGAEMFAKIDNDVIVPPGWLDECVEVMDACQELDLLGIEPPSTTVRISLDNTNGGYASCDSIGGIGLMRRRAFVGRPAMKPFATYGGFTSWQQEQSDLIKGWIAPPLKLFLLDRLTIEPWATLSRQYIAAGEQRPWANYLPADAHLWDWWKT